MKTRVTIAALALSLAVALPLTAVSGMGAVRTEEAERMLSEFIMALNAHMPPKTNAQALAGLFTEDAVQVHPFGEPPGVEQRGREAIARFFAGFDTHWSSLVHVETSRTVQGGRAVWEGFAQGVDKDTGKSLRIPIVFVLMFGRGGKVMSSRVYLADHLIAEQLE